jgi:hypothetical protein
VKEIDINVDFDGTCVTHEYPFIGKDIGAVPVLKKMVASGCNLILFTMRSGKTLDDAVRWFKNNGIKLYGIQTNPKQKSWTTSPKSLADLMIDDSALGCPLKFDATISKRPFVDWVIVEKLLTEKGIINENEN